MKYPCTENPLQLRKARKEVLRKIDVDENDSIPALSAIPHGIT